ncbi:ABC transporter ATP-binding protein [Corynebacterium sp.]|jgi:ABC-2 type transport system ATP-binding protein|uniref:ABC transporter ATP-binding protein n=1 Tax=Corynebacterium sp. TaxID=1720 RepID=UPI0025C1463B|nr:ABC transporter ATP-binding protein [Corynebacterium sp.]
MSTATTTAPVIRVRDLTRTYRPAGKKKDAYTAVDGISFDVHRGEVYGLLGTNGAGKTSSLEVIEGLAAATDGTVAIFGHDPQDDRDLVRPDLGIMLQNGGLPKELTVAETMRMWAGTCSTPRPTDEVLAEVDLNHRLTTRVGSLSGGEQRRLDLACALLNDPRVIFLDEPTTGLDPESRARTWDLLAGLKARGVTMVLTTHYLEEAERLADRIAIMHAGRIAVEGSLDELVAAEGAEITATLPGNGVKSLPDFPGALVTRDGNRLQIQTTRLQEDTHRLLAWAAGQGIAFDHFTARPASLERVFRRIAGADAQAA